MNRKRVLFVITSFATGGINRAMQNYLNRVDTSSYEIDIFALAHQGIYINQFSNCRVLPSNRAIDLVFSRFDGKKGIAKIGSALTKAIDKLSKGKYRRLLFKLVGSRLLKKEEYDAIIGYGEGAPTTFVSMMNHPNKIGWIHCDYASYFQINNGISERNLFDKLNSIVCVSEYTKQSFLSFFPDMCGKTFAIYNVMDDEMMHKQSLEPIDESFDHNFFNIVSVGRLDPVKRLSIIPQIARQIEDAGVNLRWFVIGPKGGNSIEYNKLYEHIAQYGVEDAVFPLGEKSNPYPYIAKADLLVNTSVSEACPYVINEAKILGTPVVCADFGSAKEFIENSVNGFYVPIETMASVIIRLAQNDSNLNLMRDNLLGFKYDNARIMNQIDALIQRYSHT